MTPGQDNEQRAPFVSMAIFAWNEEAGIRTTLRSLLDQTLFEELGRRGLRCEIVCVANGCSDRTAAVAEDFFHELQQTHPYAAVWSGRAVDLKEKGKINAWNRYVHQLSAREARYLCMMDADIWIHQPQTLWNMVNTLETDPEAAVAVDLPRKDIGFKANRSFTERLSVSASTLTLKADAQLCGQLYCIRSSQARRIYMPKDLAACEDGLIKTFVCTDFLAHPAWAKRIRVAPNAEHTFEAYTSPKAVLRNQKRQIIGQTMIHVLVDQYLSPMPSSQRADLAELLRSRDLSDPFWLKALVQQHLRRTRYCWRLYPGLLRHRFERLRKLSPGQRLRCLPAAVAGSCATLAASALAYRSLKNGTMSYWPKAERSGLRPVEPESRPKSLASATGLTPRGGAG